MKLPRRKFLRLVAGTVAVPTVSRSSLAQAYPSRSVRIIVGFPAGGPVDMVARLMGKWLSDRLGQQFIVENRPGAGGNSATDGIRRKWNCDPWLIVAFDLLNGSTLVRPFRQATGREAFNGRP